MSNTVPAADEEFDALAAIFVPYVATNAALLGVAAGLATAMSNGHQDWTDGYDDFKVKRTSFHAATAAKDSARRGLESLMRQAINTIQNNPAVTDEQRGCFGSC
jgi:hypothetical protein